MISAEQLLEQLKDMGVQLEINGEKLRWKGEKGVVTDELKTEMIRLKPDIQRLVKAEAAKPGRKIRPNCLVDGDCQNIFEDIPDDSIDLMITDPPYGLSFMDKDWDKAILPVDIWKECCRVLKPGAFAFIMCASRQDLQARMISKLDEAGFETHFSPLFWTYASGFPKKHNISKAVDKKMAKGHGVNDMQLFQRGDSAIYKTQAGPKRQDRQDLKSLAAKQLEGSYAGFQPKPAVEVILVVMKPLDQKSYTDQALSNGKGITWLEDCRLPYETDDRPTAGRRTCNFGDQETQPGGKSKKQWKANDNGRCIANLLVSDNILGDYSRYFSLDTWADKFNVKELPDSVQDTLPFLPVTKPSRKEREAGLEHFEAKSLQKREKEKDTRDNAYKVRTKTRRKNIHPTVKPLTLMRYLITLGSREKDVVLDPFMGSGTTCVAAAEMNRKTIGIEKNEEYCDIAVARFKKAFMAKHYPKASRN